MKNRIFNRRHFLKAIGFGAFALPVSTCLNGCGKDSYSMELAPIAQIRFGLCADVHKDIMHDADQRLQTFIDKANEENLDFIMQLGDFCRPYDYNQDFLNIFKQFNGQQYHVLGNHDMDGGFTRAQTLDYWGVKDKYYSFDKAGFHFVVLDGNDKKDKPAPGYPRYIGQQQSQWLKNDLQSNILPTLIFSHQGIGPAGGIENNLEIQQILVQANENEASGNVIACFNGHDHADASTKHNGVYYVQINSMSNQWLGGDFRRARYSKEIEEKFPWVSYTAPYKDSLYAIVTLKSNGKIEIKGVKSTFVPPAPSEMDIPKDSKYDYIRASRPEISNRTLVF